MYGLLGKSLKHSFSQGYFTEKFAFENIKASYQNFELASIEEFPNLLEENPEICGLNVTIPYKREIMPYLHHISDEAQEIGAVNTVKIEDGVLVGYNTDAFGFSQSLKPFLRHGMEKALILGTGGASSAVAYALRKIGLDVFFVSRNSSNEPNHLAYSDLNHFAIERFKLIINTTPLGTWPNVNDAPKIPYEGIGKEHLLYDLVYNPSVTKFLEEGVKRGAQTINGLSMLKLQAEKSWEIWTSDS